MGRPDPAPLSWSGFSTRDEATDYLEQPVKGSWEFYDTPSRETDLGSGSGHAEVRAGRRPVAHRVVRHEALLVSVGDERPHDQVVVAAWKAGGSLIRGSPG